MYIPSQSDIDNLNDREKLIAVFQGLEKLFSEIFGVSRPKSNASDIFDQDLKLLLIRDRERIEGAFAAIAFGLRDAPFEKLERFGLTGNLLLFKIRILENADPDGLSALNIKDLVHGGKTIVHSAVRASGAGEVIEELVDFADRAAGSRGI